MYFTFKSSELEIQVSEVNDKNLVHFVVIDETEEVHYETFLTKTDVMKLYGMLSVFVENTEDK